jgi:hypothetical protein
MGKNGALVVVIDVHCVPYNTTEILHKLRNQVRNPKVTTHHKNHGPYKPKSRPGGSRHINPLKTKRICFIQGLSAYRAVNTLHFGYKNQSLNVL